jgi:hypothetical protein
LRAEPLSDRRRLVGGVVVHDQARFEFGRDVALDLAQELASAMTRIATPDDLAGRRVQSREQEGSMAYSRGCAARFGPGAWEAAAWIDPAPQSGSSRRHTE